MNDRTDRIERALRAGFPDGRWMLEDDSHLHAGHAGAQAGGGHFRLQIVSQSFAGHPRVHRHRLVYDALAALMHREIHALSIDARAPDEI